MSILVDCSGHSEVGNVRSINEDQFFIGSLNRSIRVRDTSVDIERQTRIFGSPQGQLFVVADGLGGHNAGEHASELAIDGLITYFLNVIDVGTFRGQSDAQIRAQLTDSFHYVQNEVVNNGNGHSEMHGMATTLTMAYVDWPTAFILHVGDSRCYRVNGNTIRQLTSDHTMAALAESVADKVNLDPDDTKPPKHFSNMLWNVIGGTEQKVEVEFSKVRLEAGDSLLLCTDGLTKYVSDEELLDTVSDTSKTSKVVCEELSLTANERGGNDNITVVVSRFSTLASVLDDTDVFNELTSA